MSIKHIRGGGKGFCDDSIKVKKHVTMGVGAGGGSKTVLNYVTSFKGDPITLTIMILTIWKAELS